MKYFKSDAPNVNFLQERANNILFSLSSPSVRVHNIEGLRKSISAALWIKFNQQVRDHKMVVVHFLRVPSAECSQKKGKNVEETMIAIVSEP